MAIATKVLKLAVESTTAAIVGGTLAILILVGVIIGLVAAYKAIKANSPEGKLKAAEEAADAAADAADKAAESYNNLKTSLDELGNSYEILILVFAMRNLYILIFILVTMMFISCNKNKEPYINVDAECVTIDSDGKAVAVNIVSNCTWSLETSNNWIKVKRGTGDNSLLISAAKNTSPESRTGSVTIKGNGVSSVIKVVQEQRNTISVLLP